MNQCNPYFDEFSRKTDLMHVAEGATYPINILGNAGSADVANNPITDLSESDNQVAFRSGDELDDHSNEYKKTINNVDHSTSADQDGEGNDIISTYARKDEVVTLDPETGKVSTDLLPDTTNNVNFVNGKTGDVTLEASDIPFDAFSTVKEKVDAVVDDTNTALESLNEQKANKSEIPTAGFALIQDGTSIDSKTYALQQVGGNMNLLSKDKNGDETIESSVEIQASAVFNVAPNTIFSIPSTRRLEINFDSVQGYNMAYYWGQDQTTGVWTIVNRGKNRIYCLLFGTAIATNNDRERIAPTPYFVDVNGSFTFQLNADDPYLDRNTFGIQVFKLGSEA